MEFMAMQEEIENVDRAEPDLVEFTDEEGYGRFLDLHPVYLQYINLKNVKVIFIFLNCVKNLKFSESRLHHLPWPLRQFPRHQSRKNQENRRLQGVSAEFEGKIKDFRKKYRN